MLMHELLNYIPRAKLSDGAGLTPELVMEFERAGVLVLEDFVSVADCDRLRGRIGELVDAFDPASVKSIFSTLHKTQLGDRYFEESGDRIRFFFEKDAFDADGHLRQSKEDSLNKMGHAMHDLDPVFDEFSRSPALSAVVDSLDYDDPVILQSMVIFKPPRIGGEVRCHQDGTYLYTEPESCIGFWFALEDATLENGCMHFIPGAHKGPLKELQFRAADGKMTYKTLDDTPWPDNATVAAEAGAGTLVMFDGRAPHMSGPNKSGHSRQAYTIHVIDRSSHYPKENWLQRSPDLPFRGFR